jgi:hypothetical protein
MRKECKLRVSENTMLRRVFGPKRYEVQVSGENFIMRNLMIYTPHQILIR